MAGIAVTSTLLRIPPSSLRSESISKSEVFKVRCSEVRIETTLNGEKRKYKDSFTDLVFINGCRQAFGRVAGWQSPRSWENGYEGMVEVSHALARNKTAAEQQSAVLKGFPKVPNWFRKLFPYSDWGAELNARITPLFFSWLVGPCEVVEVTIGAKTLRSGVQIEKCRYLETSGCTGLCVNSCKMPTQYFFTTELGDTFRTNLSGIAGVHFVDGIGRMPLTMEPNFDDMSCRMIFGQTPPEAQADPAFRQRCFSTCPTSCLSSEVCPKVRTDDAGICQSSGITSVAGADAVAELEGSQGTSRRQALLSGGLLAALLLSFPSMNNAAVIPAKIDLSKAPTRPFDAGDTRLRQAAAIFQRALSARTVEEEEILWTEVIDKYGKLDAEWVPDIVSRAWGNRGNSRSRQGKMEQALTDFDRSIQLAPYAADPVLNRGVTLESLGRYAEAAADYQAVLAAQPNDPAAWNNLGNVKAALGQWDEALSNYQRAVQLAPEFSFAAANYALVLYQVGRENEAFKQFRSLLRKYPEFPDVRAALAVSLYAQGLTAEAETSWGRVEDGRYRDREWVRYTRKWPPRLIRALEGFLDVKAVAKS